jgi:hypothetical protein
MYSVLGRKLPEADTQHNCQKVDRRNNAERNCEAYVDNNRSGDRKDSLITTDEQLERQ